ncbi:MAG: hypothetical protein A2X31_10305 [Elusimicrobia bacterium GWB2_63_22]|nr:MAG: hypothetical protein A2X31_10305 [Elusimicrobia bacterium GWB2_63_22]
MPVNYRRSKRNNHNATIEIFGPEGRLLGFGRLAEYSKTGASFQAEAHLLEGELVRLRIRIFEQGILDVTARIIWRRPEKNGILVGVKFETVTRNTSTGSL